MGDYHAGNSTRPHHYQIQNVTNMKTYVSSLPRLPICKEEHPAFTYVKKGGKKRTFCTKKRTFCTKTVRYWIQLLSYKTCKATEYDIDT